VFAECREALTLGRKTNLNSVSGCLKDFPIRAEIERRLARVLIPENNATPRSVRTG